MNYRLLAAKEEMLKIKALRFQQERHLCIGAAGLPCPGEARVNRFQKRCPICRKVQIEFYQKDYNNRRKKKHNPWSVFRIGSPRVDQASSWTGVSSA